MKEKNLVYGIGGEVSACQYLKDKKYQIKSVNYRTKLGEIDIIAKKDDTTVFIEVKQRQTLAFGRPSEAVDYRKQQKIRKMASLYMLRYKLHNSPVRFDVIEILDDKINHIEGAF